VQRLTEQVEDGTDDRSRLLKQQHKEKMGVVLLAAATTHNQPTVAGMQLLISQQRAALVALKDMIAGELDLHFDGKQARVRKDY
jgi:hypothetical protein